MNKTKDINDLKSKPIPYGLIKTAKELGQVTRAHRKSRGLTLDTISGLGNLSIRFLSEFERGKETAEIGKILKALKTLGLEVIIQPRGAGKPSPLDHPSPVNHPLFEK